MNVDPVVTLGALINTAATVLTIVITGWRIIGKLNKMQMRVDLLWGWFKKEHHIADPEKETEQG